jgi:DNA-binding NarL/FixJ family response regulator
MEMIEKRIKVLLADDHKLTRTALKNIFSTASDMEVVGEAANAEEFFQEIQKTKPDVIVLDLNMPEISGLEILKRLRSEGNSIPVVILTLFPPERLKEASLEAGATNFLSKDCDPEELIETVRRSISA